MVRVPPLRSGPRREPVLPDGAAASGRWRKMKRVEKAKPEPKSEDDSDE